MVTEKFVNLIKQAEDGILDLNNAAETLQVSILCSSLKTPHRIVHSPRLMFVSIGAKDDVRRYN